MSPTATETVERLEKLGFKKASDKVKKLAEKQRKLALAYEHYRFVRTEKVDEFNKKLHKETRNDSEGYKQLSFTPVESYEETPPMEVLEALEVAIDRKCFDSYEVAHIIRVKDPILFGRIEGCSDRFFISQWDSDVSIDQILDPKEG